MAGWRYQWRPSQACVKKSRGPASCATCLRRASGASATPRLPQLPADGRGLCARLPSAARRQRAGQNQHPRSDLPHGHAALLSRRGQRADDPARAEGLLRRRQSCWPGRTRDQNVLVRARAESGARWPAREETRRLPRHAAHRGVLHRRSATDQRHGPHAPALSRSAALANAARLPAVAPALHARRPLAQRPAQAIRARPAARSTAFPRNW